MSDEELKKLRQWLKEVKREVISLAESLDHLKQLLPLDHLGPLPGGKSREELGAKAILRFWQDLRRSDPQRHSLAGAWVADTPIEVPGFRPSASVMEAIHRIAWRAWQLTLLAVGDSDFARKVKSGEGPEEEELVRLIAAKWPVVRSLLCKGIASCDLPNLKAMLLIEYANISPFITSDNLVYQGRGPSLGVDELRAAHATLPSGWPEMTDEERVQALDVPEGGSSALPSANRDAHDGCGEKVEENHPFRFERVGTVWHVRYQGEKGDFADSQCKGLNCVARLLSSPHRSVGAIEVEGGDSRTFPWRRPPKSS
jgi:hypothetical protein